MIKEQDFGKILQVIRRKNWKGEVDYPDALVTAYIVIKRGVGARFADALITEFRNLENKSDEWKTLLGGKPRVFDDVEKTVKSYVGYMEVGGTDVDDKYFKKVRKQLFDTEVDTVEEIKKYSRCIVYLSLIKDLEEARHMLIELEYNENEQFDALIFALGGEEKHKKMDDYVSWLGLIR